MEEVKSAPTKPQMSRSPSTAVEPLDDSGNPNIKQHKTTKRRRAQSSQRDHESTQKKFKNEAQNKKKNEDKAEEEEDEHEVWNKGITIKHITQTKNTNKDFVEKIEETIDNSRDFENIMEHITVKWIHISLEDIDEDTYEEDTEDPDSAWELSGPGQILTIED